MKILVPLHNEELNHEFNKDIVISLTSDDVKTNYDTVFYSEIAKFLYAADKHLINDDIIGFMQNRRILRNFESYESKILSSNKIIVPNTENFHISIYDQYNSAHYESTYIFRKILTDKEYFILTDKNNIGFFHNIFISSNEIFYSYANYLKNKLEIAYDEYKNNKNLSPNKFGAWMAERLLITFVKLNNIETIHLPLNVYQKNHS